MLSKDDSLTRINQRVRDYLDFGVPVVWVADPAEKTIWIYRPGREMKHAKGQAIRLDGTSVEFPLVEIFS